MQRSGAPTIQVDPMSTGQKCSVCGHIAKANRKT
ncbi:MAG: transposase [Chloroflexus sp.]|nr:transposase [Chloroflexus sp.]